MRAFAFCIILSAFLLPACESIDSACTGGDLGCDPASVLLLLQLKPAVGTVTTPYSGATNWADWIRNDGADALSATGTACASGDPSQNRCIRAGFLRTFSISGPPSCTDVEITDNLGVFHWRCAVTSEGLKAVLAGFQPEKGLADLIDFNTLTFRSNYITVRYGSWLPTETEASVWWTTPLVVDNNGAVAGEFTAGNIYVMTADVSSTYAISNDNVTFLMQSGTRLLGTGGFVDLITVVGASYAWIEGGLINSAAADKSMNLNNAHFTTVHNVRITGSPNNGIDFNGGSSNNRVQYLRAADCGTIGVDTKNGGYNVVSDSVISNTGLGAIGFSGVGNVFTNLLITASPSVAFGGSIFKDANYINMTVSNAGGDGLNPGNAAQNAVVIAVATNNQVSSGFNFSGNTGNTIYNIAAANHGASGIDMATGATGNRFTGEVIVGLNTVSQCSSASSPSSGIADGCGNNGTSDATFTVGVDIASSFGGRITVDDTVNPSDANGAQTGASITNLGWMNFEHMYRTWGPEGAGTGLTDATIRTTCASGSCRIYDYALRSDDAVLRNRCAYPTGNDVLTHTNSDGSVQTFLKCATEMLDDFVGDDDGLCETDERCVYTPNIGAYQGHGTLTRVKLGRIDYDNFVPGVVSGVTMFVYPNNGYTF